MIEISFEFVFVLIVVGLVVVLSGGPRVRSALLTVFGVLGFLVILSAALFVVRSSETRIANEITRIEFPPSGSFEVRTGGTPEIRLDGLEVKSPSKSAKVKTPSSKTVVAKKPAASTDTTEVEELPLEPAEPIRIDDQTRAEIERQWREGQLHDRLLYTGTGSAALLGVLATLFGYLKLDTLSRAKHRRGLQAGAAGAILAVTLVAALAAEGRLGF